MSQLIPLWPSGGGGGGGTTETVVLNTGPFALAEQPDQLANFSYSSVFDITDTISYYNSTVVSTLQAAYAAGKAIRYCFTSVYTRGLGRQIAVNFRLSPQASGGVYPSISSLTQSAGSAYQLRSNFNFIIKSDAVRGVYNATVSQDLQQYFTTNNIQQQQANLSGATAITPANYTGRMYMRVYDSFLQVDSDYLVIDNLTISTIG